MILDHSEDNSADAYDVRLGGQKATFGLADLGRSPPPQPTDIGRLPQYVRKGPRAALRFHDLQ